MLPTYCSCALIDLNSHSIDLPAALLPQAQVLVAGGRRAGGPRGGPIGARAGGAARGVVRSARRSGAKVLIRSEVSTVNWSFFGLPDMISEYLREEFLH